MKKYVDDRFDNSVRHTFDFVMSTINHFTGDRANQFKSFQYLLLIFCR